MAAAWGDGVSAYTKREEVAGAIMRAFFSRPVDEQVINVTVADNLDLADAAIEAMREADSAIE